MKGKNLSAGFTLIELLIGFALMGALLTLLLATLDPFEQQKRGFDATRTSITKNLYNAVIRSYLTRGRYPWTSDDIATPLDSAEGATLVQSLIEYGELKPNFAKLTAKDASSVYIIASKEPNTLSFCFRAAAKSSRSDAYYCSSEACYVCLGQNTEKTLETLPSFSIPTTPYPYPHL